MVNVNQYSRRDGTKVREHSRKDAEYPELKFSKKDMPDKLPEKPKKEEEKNISKILNVSPKGRKYSESFYEDEIIDAIDSEGYDENPKTKKEKLQFLKDTFKSEYGHEIARRGEQGAFKEWIMGLPTSFNIPFYNYDIIEFAKKGGSLPENPTEKEEDKILENYWNFMTAKTFKAFKKYGID